MAWYSFITSLFSGSKASDSVSGIAGAAASGIDKLFFTQEEKAEFTKEYTGKIMDVWLEGQKITVGENSIKSITRRIIAVAFTGSYLGLILLSCIMYKFDPEYSKHIFDTAKSLNTPVLTIVIFYFGYYAVANVIKAKNGGGK